MPRSNSFSFYEERLAWSWGGHTPWQREWEERENKLFGLDGQTERNIYCSLCFMWKWRYTSKLPLRLVDRKRGKYFELAFFFLSVYLFSLTRYKLKRFIQFALTSFDFCFPNQTGGMKSLKLHSLPGFNKTLLCCLDRLLSTITKPVAQWALQHMNWQQNWGKLQDIVLCSQPDSKVNQPELFKHNVLGRIPEQSSWTK